MLGSSRQHPLGLAEKKTELGDLTHHGAEGYPPDSKICSSSQREARSLRGTHAGRRPDQEPSVFGRERAQCKTTLEARRHRMVVMLLSKKTKSMGVTQKV